VPGETATLHALHAFLMTFNRCNVANGPDTLDTFLPQFAIHSESSTPSIAVHISRKEPSNNFALSPKRPRTLRRLRDVARHRHALQLRQRLECCTNKLESINDQDCKNNQTNYGDPNSKNAVNVGPSLIF
jgi:hypothetical protein